MAGTSHRSRLLLRVSMGMDGKSSMRTIRASSTARRDTDLVGMSKMWCTTSEGSTTKDTIKATAVRREVRNQLSNVVRVETDRGL